MSPAYVVASDFLAMNDTVAPSSPEKTKKRSKLVRLIREFNRIDTAYIEPQHYNYTIMLQNTTTYEIYRLVSKGGQEITFAPKPTMKVGPYFGWRWVFLGYTFDINHLSNSNRKKEIDISLYSSQIASTITSSPILPHSVRALSRRGVADLRYLE